MATRKCTICSNSIDVSKSVQIQTNIKSVDDFDDNDFFRVPNGTGFKYTHCKCYITKEASKKRVKKTEQECIEYINKQKELMIAYDDLRIKKEALYEFIDITYDISYYPKYFYMKMESVFDGTYKQLNKPCPPDDLLDMWVQKKNYLMKVAEDNRKKGNEITGLNRVYYDLAILLGKYDSYLDWKEKQIIALVNEEQAKKNSIDAIDYKDIIKPKKENKNLIDINSMLDEI